MGASEMSDTARLNQRLQDISVLAGRMAHDFDNVLTGVLGFAELTEPLLPPGTPQAHYIGEMLKVIHQGTTFTQQMHQFSRSGAVNPRPTRLQQVWDQEVVRLRPALGRAIQLDADVPANLPAVAIDGEPLRIVIGHLVANAREALATGGRLTVRAAAVALTARDGQDLFGSPSAGDYVRLSICDDGPGIRPEVKPRLLHQPFFTTKARHRGLGLATIYRIVQSHGGGLRLDAQEPHGTAASAFFPVARSISDPAPAGPSSPSFGVPRV